MAGFRTFATGEVLTAANVNNFLMKQSVMVFADATARTAALGTDVVEGMLTYNLATDQLEVFDGAAFIAARAAGIGSNVVQTVKTDTFSASVAVGAASADAMTATITPTAATSKVLVIAQLSISSGAGNTYAYLLRGGAASAYRGDAAGSRVRVAASSAAASGFMSSASIVFVDSPATTSATTYSVQLGHNGSITVAVHVNRDLNDTDSNQFPRGASSITLIEVAA